VLNNLLQTNVFRSELQICGRLGRRVLGCHAEPPHTPEEATAVATRKIKRTAVRLVSGPRRLLGRTDPARRADVPVSFSRA
jgi:hypothetical protein